MDTTMKNPKIVTRGDWYANFFSLKKEIRKHLYAPPIVIIGGKELSPDEYEIDGRNLIIKKTLPDGPPQK